MKKIYGTQAKLLFKDTDSVLYSIQTKDFYRGISRDVFVNEFTKFYFKIKVIFQL